MHILQMCLPTRECGEQIQFHQGRGGEELLNYQNEAKPSSNFACLFCPLSKYSCSYICNPLMHTYKYFASKLLCSTSHTAVKFLLRLLSYLDVFEQVCRCGCCCMLSHVSEQKSTSFTSLVYLSTKSLLQLPDTANNHDGDGLPRGTICISGRRGLCKRNAYLERHCTVYGVRPH